MPTPWVAAFVGLACFNLLLAAVVVALARQIGLLHHRVPPVGAREAPAGPPIGQAVPDVEDLSLNGDPVRIGVKSARATLLVFLSPGCGPCAEIAPAIRTLARSEKRRLDVVIASDRDRETTRTFVSDNGLDQIPVLVSDEVVMSYGMPSTPFGFAIDENGVLAAKGLINHLEHVESLAAAAIGEEGTSLQELFRRDVTV